MFGAHFIKVVFWIQPKIQGRLPYMGGFAIFQFTEVAIHSRGLAKFGAYFLFFCLLHYFFGGLLGLLFCLNVFLVSMWRDVFFF